MDRIKASSRKKTLSRFGGFLSLLILASLVNSSLSYPFILNFMKRHRKPRQNWYLLILPSPSEPDEGIHWLNALRTFPELRFTVALSPNELLKLESSRDQILELIDNERLEVALRLNGDPPISLIYDIQLSRMYLKKKIPLPQAKISWRKDIKRQILAGRMEYKKFFDFWPDGFVPGGGSLSNEIVDLLKEEKFYWSIAGFPEDEWPEGEAFRSQGESKGIHWIFSAHSLSNLFYSQHGSSQMDCCEPAREVVAEMLGELRTVSDIPILVYDEQRSKLSLIDFLNELGQQTASPASIRKVKARMALCSEAPQTKSEEDESLTPQIWPYSWGWVRGFGKVKGPGLTAWVGDPEKNKAWVLLEETREQIDRYKNSGGAKLKALDQAMTELSLAQSSRFYEWSGRIPSTESEEERNAMKFKRKQTQNQFKNILARAYHHMERPAPHFLKTRGKLSYSRSASRGRRYQEVSSTGAKRAYDGSQTAFFTPDFLSLAQKKNKNGTRIQWIETADNSPSKKESSEGKTHPVIKGFAVNMNPTSTEDKDVSFLFTFHEKVKPPAAMDLYIDINHRSGAGSTSLLPGRHVNVRPLEGWEFMLANKWLPSGNLNASLFRSNSSVPIYKSEFFHASTNSSVNGASYEVRIPSKFLGENPIRWGYLVCVLQSEQGPIVDFLSPVKNKSELLSRLRKIYETQTQSQERKLLLPMMRSDSR